MGSSRDDAMMNRRQFVGATAAGASGLATGAALLSPEAEAQTRRPARAPRPFELEELTVVELQEGMASGRWTATTIAEAYLRRIDEIDGRPDRDLPGARRGQGDLLNSMIELNPDALAIAAERDRERKAGRLRGPLHGIPIVIKDNIDTADRMLTTAGSIALIRNVARRDAFLVERLREAGAVLLGKTNLSEWANFRSTHSSSGWSGRGGQTKNPYVLTRNPCGSSSGSGAAVSANLAVLAIGTETDGSVVCPSNANGLVGIKPTVGLVSRSGIIPIAHSQDTAGAMARTVADAAALLGTLTGIDPRDPATRASEGHAHAGYTRFLDTTAMRGARIGVARQTFGFNREVDLLMEAAIETIRGLGATVIDPANLDTQGQFGESELTVLLYEFKTDLDEYLAGMPEGVPTRTLSDLIRFNEEHASEEMPYFGQELIVQAEEKGPLTTPEYLQALQKNHDLTRREGIDETLATDRLDAIIAPTGSPAWPTDLVNGDHFVGGYSSASAVAGYPHITVPLGFVFGLPVGISFFAGAWSEPKLIGLAYAFEQATRARRPPRFLAEVPLTR